VAVLLAVLLHLTTQRACNLCQNISFTYIVLLCCVVLYASAQNVM